jgi:hypothetical protein
LTEETTSADAGNVATATNAEAAAATTSQPSWLDDLPDDLKSSPSLSKFETKEGFAKSYINLEKMLGSEKVPVPKEGDAEGWARYLKAGGLPDSADGYAFTKPEKLPEGFQYDEALDKRLAGIMHKAQALPGQAKVLREELMALVAEGATQNLDAAKAKEAERSVAIERGLQALKQEWGPAFEQRGKVAGAAIGKFLSPETIAAMESAGLANDPAIIKDMYNLGVKLAGEKELIGVAEQSQSPGDLDTAIADFREKHSTALFDRSHADHGLRTKELTALFERRFGTNPAA